VLELLLLLSISLSLLNFVLEALHLTFLSVCWKRYQEFGHIKFVLLLWRNQCWS